MLKIFVSFEFEKDKSLKNSFFQQSKTLTQHGIRNSSLEEKVHDSKWEAKAEAKIKECDLVVILIGPNTHNASGIKKEVAIARRLKKPIRQIRPWKRPYNGVSSVKMPIRWKWKRINRELDNIARSLGS